MPHIRKMLEGVAYSEVAFYSVQKYLETFFQAQAYHSNLLYSRCLALLLETLLYTHKEDVVSLGHAFNAFNVDVTELRLWIRDLERGHYLKQGVAL